ncbi:hypothetical protein HYH02_007571 [Chlamydomonas schloesseri]|uniref:MYND-type domain-containing protein n=1 Tax=Chlamydomonas schloesseri TaxID=2026947 RepID=A0A835WHP4_9CHLO|nr:hypothetical protein HYH02_007571 [Chlamydomonas schloesseri]|eukprot:KAG2447655.1 hypothetical protein HYH02_007571 [Chlamydomonas schloesseri]
MMEWIDAIEKLKLLKFLEENLRHLSTLAVSAQRGLPGDTVEERIGGLNYVKSRASTMLVLLDCIPYTINLVVSFGAPPQRQRASKLLGAFLSRGLLMAVRSAVASFSGVVALLSDPQQLAALGGGGCGHDGAADCPDCNHAGLAAHLGAMNALAGAKYFRTAAQALAGRAAELERVAAAGGGGGGGGLMAAVKEVQDLLDAVVKPAMPGPGQVGEGNAAMAVPPLPTAVAMAGLRQPEPARGLDAGSLSRAAFNAHFVAKDFVTGTACLMAALDSLDGVVEGVASKEGASAAAAAARLRVMVRELEESLGSEAVVTLQRALLQRLIAHGSGSLMASGGDAVRELWLTEMEARRGCLALCDARVVGPLEASDSAPWLEDDHCCLLQATLGCWDRLAGSGSDSGACTKLPPVAVRLRLAARAGEAVWRLCTAGAAAGAAGGGSGGATRRGGLGGRLGYAPHTTWQLAMTQPLISIFATVNKALEGIKGGNDGAMGGGGGGGGGSGSQAAGGRRATTSSASSSPSAAAGPTAAAQRQALLPVAMEVVGWGLAIVSEALAAGGPDARAPLGPGGLPRSPLQAQAHPNSRWRGLAQLMGAVLSTIAAAGVDVGRMSAALRAQVVAALWRCGAALSLDRVLRLSLGAAAAAAASAGGGGAGGADYGLSPTGGVPSPRLVMLVVLPLMDGQLLPLLAPRANAAAAAAAATAAGAGATATRSSAEKSSVGGGSATARLGLLVTTAKHAAALARQLQPPAAGGGPAGPSPAAASPDQALVHMATLTLLVISGGLAAFRWDLQQQLTAAGTAAALQARHLTDAAAFRAATIRAVAAYISSEAAEAVAFALRAAATLAAELAEALVRAAPAPAASAGAGGGGGGAAGTGTGTVDVVSPMGQTAGEAVGNLLVEWGRCGMFPLNLGSAQLLACQPPRLLAAAAALLAAAEAGADARSNSLQLQRGRKALAQGLVEACVAGGNHVELGPLMHTWLAPPPSGSSGSSGSSVGCLRAPLQAALPALVKVLPHYGACVVALLREAASQTSPPPPLPELMRSSSGSSSGGGDGDGSSSSSSSTLAAVLAAAAATTSGRNQPPTDFYLAANNLASYVITASKPEEAVLVLEVEKPGPDGFKLRDLLLETIQQQRQQQQQQQPAAERAAGGAAAAGLLLQARRLAVSGLEAPLPLLRVCGNPDCGRFDSGSEAALDLKLCGRCRCVRYCCGGCQAAHWKAGHKAECARLAASGAAAAAAEAAAAAAAAATAGTS